MTRGDDALGDGGNLGRRLAEAEDDFGKSLPQCSVVVDAREAQVFERRLAQKLKEPVVRLPQVSGVPCWTSSRRARSSGGSSPGGFAAALTSSSSRTVKSSIVLR